MSFFKSRGFNEMPLNKTAKETAEKSCSNFFPDNDGTLTQVLKDMGKSTTVPFVTTWSHKLSGFQKSLHYHYKEMINNFPNLKSVFSEPPILSYCHNQTLHNFPVCYSINRSPPCQNCFQQRSLSKVKV